MTRRPWMITAACALVACAEAPDDSSSPEAGRTPDPGWMVGHTDITPRYAFDVVTGGADGAGGAVGAGGDTGVGGAPQGEGGDDASASSTGSGATPPVGSGPSGSTSSTGSGGTPNPLVCSGYTPQSADATYVGAPAFPGYDQLLYTASTPGPVYDVLSLEIYFDYGASDQLEGYQPYPVTAQGYDTCKVCLLKFVGCSVMGGQVSCAKTFLADVGMLHLDALGRGESTLEGSMEGVQFREVRIDPGTLQSTPVAGGERICLNHYEFSQAVSAVE